MKNLIILSLFLTIIISCAGNNASQRSAVTIQEVYQTLRDEPANIDSPAFWKGPEGQCWLMATAKDSDAVYVADARNGKHLKKIGSKGDGEGEFAYPNGIFVIDNLLFIVERDNQRVQVMSLPGFNFVTFFGQDTLRNPYGIYINKKSEGSYQIYITDNYQTADEEIPPASDLNHRVHLYQTRIEDFKLAANLVKTFGETSGPGVLRIVESIYADPESSHLLIAEEDTTESAVKVYDLEGRFLGKRIGKGLFKRQVEGIALYTESSGKGFWIVTDQSHQDNRFLLFSRKSFKFLGSFKGPKTTNTDGIWLTQESFGSFKKGAIFAVHDDGNVSAFDLAEIIKYASSVE